MAMRTETGRECPVPFPIDLGALSAPKLDSDAGGVVWVGADVWEQYVSARFRFSPLFVELCVCFYLGALRAPKLDSDAGGGVG